MVITARDTKIKPGYKQTEVGVIPEDWKIEKLGDCLFGIPQYGINAPAVQYTDSLPIYIRITDITDEGCFSPENIASVKCVDVDRYALNAGDLVFARTGASVGKTYLYKPEDGNLVFAGYLIRVKVNPSKLLPGYLAAYVKTEYYWSWVRVMSMRSGQPGINGTEYARLPIPLPPLPEQHAIATALSDVDALITSLDKLIAKKRDIKQATMQQLLIGKMRLPGFSKGPKQAYKQTEVGVIPEEWDVKNLRDLCTSIVDGTHYTPRYVSDGIPFYSVENVTANNFADTKSISLKEHQSLIRRCKPEKGDILLTRIGSLGYTKLVDWDINASIYVSLALLKINNQLILPDYMYAYSKSKQFVKDVEKRSLMNATPIKINMDQIGNIPIPRPSFPEQQAIATILSDMDAEIAALEQKRDKTRALKQGMMQELLTGKIRLVAL